MYRILIVEDDAVIARTVKSHIDTWGCQARCVTDFRHVLSDFAAYDPQLVLMDISLPFFNGYHWCTEIRKVSKVPIIFISSASDNMNLIMAINLGGDDFLAKPFDLSVLTAKVQAMLRRTYAFGGQASLIEHKGAILNTGDSVLTYNGQRLELSRNEYKLLHLLMDSRGNAVTREALMTRLWETDSFIDDNTLTVNMTRLRKKLEDAGLDGFITTKKGVGYIVD